MITFSASPSTLQTLQATQAVRYISTPETLSKPNHTVRYIVELTTIGAEFDLAATPTQTIDLCFVKPTQESVIDAITSVLTARGLLQGFEILRFWIPTDCDRF